jgi:hypothetical protein
MILRHRQQVHPNPRLLYGEPDRPETLANPAERIPCVNALTIRPSSPWPQFEDADSKFIKMLCGFQKATTGTNVIGAVRKAEIISRSDDEHRKLVYFIDREKASDVSDWNQTKRRIPFEAFSGKA